MKQLTNIKGVEPVKAWALVCMNRLNVGYNTINSGCIYHSREDAISERIDGEEIIEVLITPSEGQEVTAEQVATFLVNNLGQIIKEFNSYGITYGLISRGDKGYTCLSRDCKTPLEAIISAMRKDAMNNQQTKGEKE